MAAVPVGRDGHARRVARALGEPGGCSKAGLRHRATGALVDSGYEVTVGIRKATADITGRRIPSRDPQVRELTTSDSARPAASSPTCSSPTSRQSHNRHPLRRVPQRVI